VTGEMKKKLLILSALAIFVLGGALPAAAKPSEYDLIVRHLKTKYRAKKVKIPFMFLARFAVGVVRPAGVKSFGVTLFKDLRFSYEELDREMQSAMRSSFGREWSPALRVRTREGQQAYMYMREDGKNVRIALVTIDKQQAAVIRATFSPERLADFINNPKILGIPLGTPAPLPEESPETQAVPETQVSSSGTQAPSPA
jgi:hypothetical protein